MNTSTETSATSDLRAQSLASATRLLLAARTPAGHWVGELSSSALSTATAVFALYKSSHTIAGAPDSQTINQSTHQRLITAGLDWLIHHQNPDGGWGDTTISLSNISTTALCWATLGAAHRHASDAPATQAALAAANAWLARAAGSLAPADLARAIVARYGKDRTFSVPILTLCALAGRLGADNQDPWRFIPQLPFELAAFPQSWFRFFRLPVVSYALPALISMGLARHRNRPTWNPLARIIRRLTTRRVLRVLSTIQPTGGGFLEATPLTSFVAMSLIGAGFSDHPVVAHCVDFLMRSARPDGSWPIDTNLATWITTLSVNALSAGGGSAAGARIIPPSERAQIRDWLLGQQYRARHPYTGAPPGAWAWTDLPGGVPDADDTAGALLALHQLGASDEPAQVARTLEAATLGVQWLLNLQNSDGGIPTFCRGWTNLPFDRSGPDLTAHALLALAAWRSQLPSDFTPRIDTAASKAQRYLEREQRADGSWLPLWFGNQANADDENPTYGTAKVLFALLTDSTPLPQMAQRGVTWLLKSQNPDGGWGGGPKTPSSIEETALAVDALALASTHRQHSPNLSPDLLAAAVDRGCAWLIARTQAGHRFDPSPIGFYFAKLWYFEREYPLILFISALSRVEAASRNVIMSAE